MTLRSVILCFPPSQLMYPAHTSIRTMVSGAGKAIVSAPQAANSNKEVNGTSIVLRQHIELHLTSAVCRAERSAQREVGVGQQRAVRRHCCRITKLDADFTHT